MALSPARAAPATRRAAPSSSPARPGPRTAEVPPALIPGPRVPWPPGPQLPGAPAPRLGVKRCDLLGVVWLRTSRPGCARSVGITRAGPRLPASPGLGSPDPRVTASPGPQMGVKRGDLFGVVSLHTSCPRSAPIPGASPPPLSRWDGAMRRPGSRPSSAGPRSCWLVCGHGARRRHPVHHRRVGAVGDRGDGARGVTAEAGDRLGNRRPATGFAPPPYRWWSKEVTGDVRRRPAALVGIGR